MNLSNIIHEIAQQDPEFYERVSPRRLAIRNFSRKVALTALPFALGSLLKKAYGKTNDVIVDTLNFALKLEYLESEYYNTALNTPTLTATITSPADLNDIRLLAMNETGHRDFVKQTIITLGGIPYQPTTIDFSGGLGPGGAGAGNGPFASWNTNYDTFLSLAQAFEETGIRAYKGGAPNLMSNDEVLESALRIHSVEARHEAHIRMMRKRNGFTTVKPWVTLNQSGISSPDAQAPYDGEELTTQATINLVGTTVAGNITITANGVSEAFDEPLTMDQVNAIAGKFIV